MDGQPHMNRPPRRDEFGRLVLFAVFTTTGMGAIALALLAQPLNDYFRDRDLLAAQRQRIEQLQNLHQQQQQLLANSDNPSVVERAAINNLNYVPTDTPLDERQSLPKPWSDLEKALGSLDKAPSLPERPPWQQAVETLSQQRDSQNVLLALGAFLIVVSLACFYRQA